MDIVKKSPIKRELKKDILRSVDILPPVPKIMHKVRDVMEDPNANYEDLADIIKMDQSLTMKILKVSNSAYYRRSREIVSVQDAIIVLGLNTLSEVITIAFSQKLLGSELKGYGLAVGALFLHSIAVALGAKIIALRKAPNLSNEAFTAGIIHDVGKIILAPYVYDQKKAFRHLLEKENETLTVVEKKILGYDHGEIASMVCNNWKFPKTISTAIKYHHQPSRILSNKLSTIIYTANQLADWAGLDSDGITLEIEPEVTQILDLDISEIEPIMNEITSSVSKVTRGL